MNDHLLFWSVHGIMNTSGFLQVSEALDFTLTLQEHTGNCIRRFGGIYAYCRYFIDRKWQILVLILYRETCHMPKGL